MAKTAKGKSQPGSSPAEAEPSSEISRTLPHPEHVAVRAYHIYLERGDSEGDPVGDWLQAENELAEVSD